MTDAPGRMGGRVGPTEAGRVILGASNVSRILRAAGEAMYGPRRRREVAKALDVSDRAVRRWVAGDEGTLTGVAADLDRLCGERIVALDAVRTRLSSTAGS